MSSENPHVCQDPNALQLKFKRKGLFDDMRRQLLEQFQSSSTLVQFEQDIARLCERFVNDRERKTDEMDKVALQRRLLRDLEDKHSLFRDVKAYLNRKLDSQLQDGIQRELEAILDDDNEWTVSQQQENQDVTKVEDGQKKKVTVDIIDEILSYAPLKKPSPPVSPMSVTTDVSRGADVTGGESPVKVQPATSPLKSVDCGMDTMNIDQGDESAKDYGDESQTEEEESSEDDEEPTQKRQLRSNAARRQPQQSSDNESSEQETSLDSSDSDEANGNGTENLPRRRRSLRSVQASSQASSHGSRVVSPQLFSQVRFPNISTPFIPN